MNEEKALRKNLLITGLVSGILLWVAMSSLGELGVALLVYFPSVIAMAAHGVIGLVTKRGLNAGGKAAMCLHVVGLAIGAWALLSHESGLSVLKLGAGFGCPLLALFTFILIEAAGRSGRVEHPIPLDANFGSELSSPNVTPPATSVTTPQTAPQSFPQRSQEKRKRVWSRFAALSALLFWTSYRCFTLSSKQDCDLFEWNSFRTHIIRDYLGKVLQSVCENGYASILAVWILFFALVSLAYSMTLLRRGD